MLRKFPNLTIHEPLLAITFPRPETLINGTKAPSQWVAPVTWQASVLLTTPPHIHTTFPHTKLSSVSFHREVCSQHSNTTIVWAGGSEEEPPVFYTLTSCPHPSLALPLYSCCSCCVSQCPFTRLALLVFILPFIQRVGSSWPFVQTPTQSSIYISNFISICTLQSELHASDVFLSWGSGEALEQAQKAVGVPSLKMFKVRLDGPVRNLV